MCMYRVIRKKILLIREEQGQAKAVWVKTAWEAEWMGPVTYGYIIEPQK